MKITDELVVRIKIDEGKGPNNTDDRHMVYTDTVGIATLGYGRNLVHRGISEGEAQFLLGNDLIEFAAELEDHSDFADLFCEGGFLDQVRQEVLLNMAFNMGVAGLAKFVNFLAAVRRKDWVEAKKQMLNSKWAGQVHARADRLAEQLLTGVRQ